MQALGSSKGDPSSSALFYLICLFLPALGLCCFARTFSSCGKQELLFVAVHGLFTVAVSLIVGA